MSDAGYETTTGGAVLLDRPIAVHQENGNQEDVGFRPYNIRPERYSEVRRARAEIEDVNSEPEGSDAREEKRSRYEREMLARINAEKEAADQLKNYLAREAHGRIRDQQQSIADVNLRGRERNIAQQIQGDVLATLEMIRNGVIHVPNESTQELLNGISDLVSADQVAPNELIFLHNLLEPLISNGVRFSAPGDPNKTPFEMEFQRLAGLETGLADSIYNLLASNRDTFAVNDDKLRELGAMISATQEKRQIYSEAVRKHNFDSELAHFNRFFGDDEKAIQIMRAINSPTDFHNYFNKIKAQYPNEPDKLSKQIMDDIRLTFNKLTRQTYHKRPTAIFAEEIRKGFPDSIENAITKFTLKITNLVDHIDEYLKQADPDLVEGKVLTMQASALKKGVYYVDTKRRVDNKFQFENETDRVFSKEKRDYMHSAMSNYTVVPTHKLEAVTMREFLEGLELAVDTEFEMTEYFYNIQTITSRGGHGEGGHWESIKPYAEHLTALGLDTIPLIVDSDMIMSARRLYLKFLRAQFASYNWIHSPGMFMSDFFSNKSDTLRAVTEQLKIMYPQYANNPEESWRIDQAMSKAVGISFGLTLDEPEMAAWADAPIVVRNDKDAEATAQSFYRGDSRILSCFDPWIDVLRFQGEDQSIGPLIYAMLKDNINKPGLPFDHRSLWENMERFKKSFREGRGLLEDLGDESYMAINQMKNFFEIGSIFYRGGWRDAKAIDGWIDKNHLGQYKDINQAWESVKYIGSQVGMRLLASRDFQKALSAADRENKADAFLEKLFNDYIKPIEDYDNSKNLTFASYMRQIEDDAKRYEDLMAKYNLTKDQLHSPQELKEAKETAMKFRHVSEEQWEEDISTMRRLSADAEAIKPKPVFIGEGEEKKPPEEIKKLQQEQVRTDKMEILMNRAIAAQMMRWAPTRFLTLERSRMTTDGVRMYDRVRQAAFRVDIPEYEKQLNERLAELNNIEDAGERERREKEIREEVAKTNITKEKSVDLMDQSLRDIMIVEELLREETSNTMREHLAQQRKEAIGKEGPSNLRLDNLDKKYNIHESYNVNAETIRARLTKLYLEGDAAHHLTSEQCEHIEERINNAVKVYEKTRELYRRDGYVAARGADIRENKYRITLGNDDLDWEFMAYRNAGERPHGRAIGDMARAEKAGHLIGEFEKVLQQIATNPEKPDDTPLINLIEEVHNTVKSTHSFEKAGEKSYLLAKLASLYFRQDADHEKWWKGFGGRKLHSLAAEFAGSNHVFDWDAITNYQFLERLKIRRLLRPNRTYNDLNAKGWKKQPGRKISQFEDWSAEKLEQEMAAHKQNILLRIGHTYGPAAILVLSFLYLRHALKEEEESRR